MIREVNSELLKQKKQRESDEKRNINLTELSINKKLLTELNLQELD